MDIPVICVYLLIIMLIMSVITFCAYAIDKQKAKNHSRRIRERTLLLLALFMGGPGACLGMKICRHKTKHTSFRILVPLFTLVDLAVLAIAYIYY